MTSNRILISTYWSDDQKKRAEVFHNLQAGYEIDFFEDDKYILSESYEDKNLYYHEDAAENYVMGVKDI